MGSELRREATAWRRIVAYVIDWCLFAAWAGLVVLVALWLQGGEPGWPTSVWHGQLLGFALTTLPFGMYFVLTEGASRQATIGKRVLGLQVASTGGGRPTRTAVSIRTLGKLLPWEMGHCAAHQFLAADRCQLPAPPWAMLLAVVSIAAAIGYIACLFTRSGRTPYDRLAGTWVVRAARPLLVTAPDSSP